MKRKVSPLWFFDSMNGQPPLQAANIKSFIVKEDSQSLMLMSGLSNKSIIEICPFDSPLSYKLIGFISILWILPVPECIMLSSSTTVEPVRIYNPYPSLSSMLVLTESHNTGATCHSSINRGLFSFNNLEGSMSAHIIFVL